MKKEYLKLGFWVFMTWLITAVHHVYTGYIYRTPWRAEFGYTALIPTIICLLILVYHYHFPFKMLKIMITMQVTIFFFLVIGIWEGAWCHGTKLICYFLGIPFSNAPASFNIPIAPTPTDIFSEVTGVLNFVVALVTLIVFIRWRKSLLPFTKTTLKERIYLRYKLILLNIYGKHEGIILFDKFIVNYNSLIIEKENHMNKALIKHQDQVIIPSLALYYGMCDMPDRINDPRMDLQKFYLSYYLPHKFIYRVFGKLPFCFWMFRKILNKTIEKTYPSIGFPKSYVSNNKECVCFNMNGCFYYNTLAHYDAVFLTEIFCLMDHYLYDDMSDQITFTRRTTISKGDQQCDFLFESSNRSLTD